MSSLLPPNSTQLEKAVEQATKGIGEIPVPIRTLWNANDCPEAFLPWLAWAYSVDQWDDNWTIQQKRNTVDVAIRVHQKKGTPSAMKTAIAALGYQLELVEWFQETGRAPGTFGIDITLKDGQGLNATPTLIDTINRTKNVRSHLWGIRYKTHSRGQQYIGAAQSHGIQLHIFPLPPVFLNTVLDENGVLITDDNFYLIDNEA